MSRESPWFTVVVPTHAGRSSISAAVASILAQTHRHFELIVVSDGDATRTREFLRDVDDSRLSLVEQAKTGVSAARNHGVRSGHYEWVIFLDDDDTVRDDWLEFYASQVGVGVAAVTGDLLLWPHGRQPFVYESRLALSDLTLAASSILPAGFVVRRDLFLEVGGFDERLVYSENQDLGLRLADHILARHQDLQVVNTHRVVADLYREAPDSRSQRYGLAPASSARVFVARYSGRLAGDPVNKAALYRLIARADRVENRGGAAVAAAWRAVHAQPAAWANHRSLAIALANLVVITPVRRIARSVPALRSRQGPTPHTER